jgi:hypothetical protein
MLIEVMKLSHTKKPVPGCENQCQGKPQQPWRQIEPCFQGAFEGIFGPFKIRKSGVSVAFEFRGARPSVIPALHID